MPTVFSKIVVYRWVGSPSRTSTARYFVSPPSANILLTAAEIVSGLTTEDSVAAATSSLMKKQPPGPSRSFFVTFAWSPRSQKTCIAWSNRMSPVGCSVYHVISAAAIASRSKASQTPSWSVSS